MEEILGIIAVASFVIGLICAAYVLLRTWLRQSRGGRSYRRGSDSTELTPLMLAAQSFTDEVDSNKCILSGKEDTSRGLIRLPSAYINSVFFDWNKKNKGQYIDMLNKGVVKNLDKCERGTANV